MFLKTLPFFSQVDKLEELETQRLEELAQNEAKPIVYGNYFFS